MISTVDLENPVMTPYIAMTGKDTTNDGTNLVAGEIVASIKIWDSIKPLFLGYII